MKQSQVKDKICTVRSSSLLKKCDYGVKRRPDEAIVTLVLQTRTKTKGDGRTQVNIFEILFRRLLGLAILRKANFPKLGLKCQRQRIASVENAKRSCGKYQQWQYQMSYATKSPFSEEHFWKVA